jgi:hypothetical protein
MRAEGYTLKTSTSCEIFFNLNVPRGVRAKSSFTLSAVALESNTPPPDAREPILAATLVVIPLAVYVQRDPV